MKNDLYNKQEILLNIMYSGTYLENENIGHEIINLFKDDNGNNYIYVLPYGTMAAKHNDKIKTILLVRRCNSKVFEILAKATDLEQVAYLKNSQKSDIQNIILEEKQYINDNKITYGGIPINKIFEENTDKIKTTHITFKANKITKVAKSLYITVDKLQANENCFYLNDIEYFPSQSPKMYIENDKQAYNILEKLISDNAWWEKENTTQKIQAEENLQTDDNNFIDIIKKNHDELTYSWLFKYIFEASKEGFIKFTNEVLSINFTDDDFKIIRESEENIDLLIKSDNSVIVIENKIKSSINGICERHDMSSHKMQSQLKKYYDYIEKTYSNKKVREYFIFSPNYNYINLDMYECGNYYNLIEYSKIYKFFEENKDLYKNVKYFDEFLYAIKQHAKPVDNRHEEEMHKRFNMAINKLKNQE